MKFRKKHIKIFATVFLITYSLFIIAAALHTHKHAFHTYAQNQTSNWKTSHKINNSFVDDGSECPLCQFNLTKFFNEPDAGLFVQPLQKSFLQQITYNSQYFSQYFFNINFRAPPVNS
jgi:hypothetical protein